MNIAIIVGRALVVFEFVNWLWPYNKMGRSGTDLAVGNAMKPLLQ